VHGGDVDALAVVVDLVAVTEMAWHGRHYRRHG
jgi:hypothetical protein